MAFTDLPEDWSSHPITDPALIADVLDLFVTTDSRYDGAVYLFLCDAQDRLMAPVSIDGSHVPTGADRVSTLSGLLQALAEHEPDAGVLVAIARPGGLSATDDDRDWAEAANRAATGRVRLLGVHVVTPDGSRPVPADRRAA